MRLEEQNKRNSESEGKERTDRQTQDAERMRDGSSKGERETAPKWEIVISKDADGRRKEEAKKRNAI